MNVYSHTIFITMEYRKIIGKCLLHAAKVVLSSQTLAIYKELIVKDALRTKFLCTVYVTALQKYQQALLEPPAAASA